MDPSGEWDWAGQWDHVFNVLSAEPRREIIRTLLKEPQERRLPLPEAAESPNQSMDSGTLAIQLRHHHLPMLADANYVRWETDPFCVQRGPNFEEPAFIIETMVDSVDEMPDPLVDNCKILQKMIGNDEG